jgi:hypothetical protein
MNVNPSPCTGCVDPEYCAGTFCVKDLFFEVEMTSELREGELSEPQEPQEPIDPELLKDFFRTQIIR